MTKRSREDDLEDKMNDLSLETPSSSPEKTTLFGQTLPLKPRLSPIKQGPSIPVISEKRLKITLFSEDVRKSNRGGRGK